MSEECVVSVLALCLLMSMIFANFSVLLVEAEPVERGVGVKVGDMVKYGDFLALWDSENRAATVPLDLIEVNNTLWIIDTVRSVSGTSVTFETQTHYRNGTERSRVAQVDVITGGGSGNITFVAAGLAAGDTVYTSGELSSARINSTLPRAYVGITRETNLLNVTQISIEESRAFWSEFFWDKTTGVLVEQFWSYAEIDESGYLTEASVEYKMVDNNIWIGVPDDVPPVADAGSDQTVEFGAGVAFDAGGSRDNVGIARFLWSFGDGSSGEGMRVVHTYAGAGVYDVVLTVEDARGNSATDRVTVTVKEGPSSQLPLLFIGGILFVALLFVVWLLYKRR